MAMGQGQSGSLPKRDRFGTCVGGFGANKLKFNRDRGRRSFPTKRFSPSRVEKVPLTPWASPTLCSFQSSIGFGGGVGASDLLRRNGELTGFAKYLELDAFGIESAALFIIYRQVDICTSLHSETRGDADTNQEKGFVSPLKLIAKAFSEPSSRKEEEPDGI
ncbi:hypothetical protein Salat_2596200 [Sesamum alatum]|uniref:Uncharacterized protein n=1 Tax=Sesamum alatum TaxID=300844 RepID=A0AAE1XMZ5_9LAMI|nr:hypothetical protein Salat_2596200 [Sesamum alatum]